MLNRARIVAMGAAVAVSLVVPEAVGSASDQFEDVPSGHVFHDDIAWLADSGITRGCNPPANTRFCPNDEVTRGQMAAFLVRALNLPAAGDQGLTDTASSVFRADIDALAAAGITKGCNPPANTRFCPNDQVTRAQMAAFLNRALAGPGNGLVAFVSDRHGGDTDIFVMNPDGTGVRNLTPDSPTGDFDPAWSPDGTKIAFASRRVDADRPDIFVMNADGSNPINLTAEWDHSAFSPTFSPDGSKIAFSSSDETTDNRAIFEMNADGSNIHVLYDTVVEDRSPEYSPDGRMFGGFGYSFCLFPCQSFASAYVAAYNDSGAEGGIVFPQAITFAGPHVQFEDFSPDSTLVLFDFFHWNDPAADLYTLPIDDLGGEPTNLTNTSDFSEIGAAYSPDGSLIVYGRRPANGGSSDIYVMTHDGKLPRNLTSHPANDFSPAWQPIR